MGAFAPYAPLASPLFLITIFLVLVKLAKIIFSIILNTNMNYFYYIDKKFFPSIRNNSNARIVFKISPIIKILACLKIFAEFFGNEDNFTNFLLKLFFYAKKILFYCTSCHSFRIHLNLSKICAVGI